MGSTELGPTEHQQRGSHAPWRWKCVCVYVCVRCGSDRATHPCGLGTTTTEVHIQMVGWALATVREACAFKLRNVSVPAPHTLHSMLEEGLG